MFVVVLDVYRRFARSHPVSFICINLIFVILWINTIMWFSGENAEISGGRSAQILVSIVNAVDPDANVTLENYESIVALDNCEKVIRKLAHMFEYGVLAFLVCATSFGFRNLPRRYACIASVLFAGVVGIADERNQTVTDGRYGSWVDVCIDMLGAAIAVMIVYHLTIRYRRRKRKTNNHPVDRNDT